MDFDKLIAAVLAISTMNGRFTYHIVQLCSSEARVTASSKPASYRILQVLNLRNVVKNLPLLRQALKGCQSQLLRIVCEVKYSTNSQKPR
jgi:DNA mismatch repair protein MSH4